ncbi:MAG: hypothetical protein ACKO0Z_09620 [Betaproteobacteria bacterium]
MAKQNSLPSIDTTSRQSERRDEPEGYMPRRIDVKLPLSHRRLFKRKMTELMDSNARLADGTEVTDRAKTFLWILENMK